jgi:hypothetical protein
MKLQRRLLSDPDVRDNASERRGLVVAGLAQCPSRDVPLANFGRPFISPVPPMSGAQRCCSN